MRDERLLERIYMLEKDPDRREGHDPARQINSILKHLQRVLNTKQGSVPIADDYGIPDFTDLPGAFSTGSTHEVEHIIKNVIEEEEVLSLRFEIDAKLASGKNDPVSFETVVNAGGMINIKE
jgi:type VI secretion system protein